ncbi:hypothetical protein AAG570_002123 [Ranatra chinensis]|uniref:Centromere/kinetochore protein zw10-like protein n=1 Tax=Ranatra chinensis TaxID=642074 RepID=A0ABD0Y6K8_9HEMI
MLDYHGRCFDSLRGLEAANEIKQLKELRESLEEYVYCTVIINRLIEIDGGIQSALHEQAAANYCRAAELLLSSEEWLTSVDTVSGENSLEWLDIYEALLVNISVWKEKFILEANAHWQSSVEWNTIEVSDKSKIVSLQISNETFLKENLVRTLNLYGLAYIKIKAFAETLMDDMLVPVLTSECSVSRGPSSPLVKEDSTVLSVNINFLKKNPPFLEVYNNLVNVFNYISLMLNVDVSKGKTFFTLMGEYIGKQFLKLFVSESLHRTIPLSRDDLKDYENVIQKTKDLEKMLLDQGFLAVKEEVNFQIQKTAEEPTVTMTDVWANASQFPYCQISKSVDDLLRIANEAVVESIQNDDKFSSKLFECARDIFIRYMKTTPSFHEDLLENIPQQSGLATVCDNEIFPKSIEQGINQCLRLLVLLQMVWQNVLPANKYCDSMGLLCNSFVEEIIQTVVAMKDIREDVATQMVEVFKRIQNKAPSVFIDPNEVHRHVKRWSRFGELIRVLSAHLFEIEERWADGKGPLALEFKPDQVRRLVKALFQSSEKRTGVLSRIN